MTTPPQAPTEHYTREYFEKWNYADRGLGKYSMYWFARRYYAALVRRYTPPAQAGEPERKLMEMGCGLGHLLGLLQDDFHCVGIDLIDYSIEQTRLNAPKAEAFQMSADDLSAFESNSFSVVVALHLVEHLPNPEHTIQEVNRILKPGGLWLFATPHPDYSLRRFKDRDNDAIGKDKTHINVHPPQQWRAWCEQNGFKMVKHFGDGLWDVPYLPILPKVVQFGLFGVPALAQVVTRTTWTPLSMGVNQIGIARKL
ncbi:MAG: methyltransferase domain-containing protein [Anaerolineaceae bacterium]|nr:methyltransferase domain-containing protein [Anaerolineaceae bacterium]